MSIVIDSSWVALGVGGVLAFAVGYYLIQRGAIQKMRDKKPKPEEHPMIRHDADVDELMGKLGFGAQAAPVDRLTKLAQVFDAIEAREPGAKVEAKRVAALLREQV